MVKSLYNQIKLKQIHLEDHKEYIVIESCIGENLEEQYHKFTESEIFTILNDENRVVLNMVPVKVRDIFELNYHASNYDPF